jgi:hypothetical protein
MRSQVPLVLKLPFYLNSLSKKVFSEEELGQEINAFSRAINSPIDASERQYINYLVDNNLIQKILLESETLTKERLILKGASKYEIATSIKEACYISHLSAAYIHRLVKAEPKLIYVSFEGSQRTKQGSAIEQDAINKAFEKPQRVSNSIIGWENNELLLLTGQYTERAGITKKDNFHITTIGRTLIDMTVRPAYSGGSATVLQAYKEALNKKIDFGLLIRMYDEMELVYPYHQSIGFYLEKIGYQGEMLDELRTRSKEYTFYLDYAINNKAYSKDWNLYYPSQVDL